MDRVNRHRQWLPKETESPAATPLSSADMWREPKMPRGEISKPEVEVLNLWRRLPDKLKRVAYSQMQTLMLARRQSGVIRRQGGLENDLALVLGQHVGRCRPHRRGTPGSAHSAALGPALIGAGANAQHRTVSVAPRRHGPHRSVTGRRLDGLCLELGSAGTV